MFATRFLLLGVLIFGWADLSLSEDPSWQGWADKGMKEGNPPQTDSPNTSNSYLPPLYINGSENEIWELGVSGNCAVLSPTSGSKGTITGGAFGLDVFDFDSLNLCFEWNDNYNKCTAHVLYSNKNEAPSSNITKAEILCPIYAMGNVDNPGTTYMISKMALLKSFKDIVRGISGFFFEFFKGFQQTLTIIVKYIRGFIYNIITKKNLNCMTAELPVLNTSNYMSEKQFNFFVQIINFLNQNQSNNNPPPTCKPVPNKPIQQGKGCVLTPT